MDHLLEFEHEALLDILNQNSLTISAKGLLNDRLLFHLVQTYCNPCHLVFVIGTNIEEEDSIINQIDEYVSKQSEEELEEFQRPQQISYASIKSQDRRKLYLGGGVIFITTQILIIDMLTKRVPYQSVSGIIVANAHRVLKDCHMSFILRLFRMNNKTGFITALSQNAASFLGSFGQLEKCMRKLFVGHLNLWPRFQVTIKDSLSSRKPPKVNEYRIEMTPMMKQIQFTLLDLISKCIKDLSNMNYANYSFDSTNSNEERSLNTISVISNNFNKLIRLNLDSVWYQLSTKARRYIRDIQLLKSLLFHLTELDAVTFYGEIKHIRDSVTPDSNPSDWLFWAPADTLFKLSEERVFTRNSFGEKKFQIEINPKLEALMELLKDIEKKIIEERQSTIGNDEKLIVDIIIVVENVYTIAQIEQFQDKGREIVLDELKKKCELFSSGKKIEMVRKSKTIDSKNKEQDNENTFEFEDQLTLTQMICKLEDYESSIIRKHQLFQIHYYKWSADNNYGLGLKHLLTTLRPRFVILYEPEMSSIRQIEIYQALHGKPDHPEVEVNYFIFDGSAEEQRYLRNLQIEKESFEKLIQEKSKLPNVRENEGLEGEHPDLVRGTQTLFHPDEISKIVNSRIGGMVQSDNSCLPNRIVLVDLREFRSMLPAYIHKIGIDLEPVTLEIGDYIITPESCIERKSIPDLIQSLINGRLYSQIQIMTRHYRKPLLLIEFPDDSFSFKSRVWGNAIMNSSCTTNDSSSKPNPLVQLAVLTIQFPLLRLIWSPSANFTADTINELKKGKNEPSKETDIIRVNLDQDQELPVEYITDRFDIETKEFLLCLPGVTPHNVYIVMNQYKCIADLIQQSVEELTEKVGSSHHAELMYRALHDPVMLEFDSQQKQQAKEKQRFTYVRKRKSAK